MTHKMPYFAFGPLLVALAFSACSDDETTPATTATTTAATTTTAQGTGGQGAQGGEGQGASGAQGGGTTSCDSESNCANCVACADNNDCAAEKSVCGAGSACQDYFDCEIACNENPACIATCKNDHPEGAADGEALISCLCSACSMSCGANPLCM